MPILIKKYQTGGKYETKLTSEELKKFNEWKQNIHPRFHDETYFDLKGAFKHYKGLPYYIDEETGEKVSFSDETSHMIDKFKKPGHPTFSTESMYSSEETPGGEWTQDEDGTWFFHHSPYTAKYKNRTTDYLHGSGEYSIMGKDTIGYPEKRLIINK